MARDNRILNRSQGQVLEVRDLGARAQQAFVLYSGRLAVEIATASRIALVAAELEAKLLHTTWNGCDRLAEAI